MSAGPRECTDPGHGHVLMCPVQATQIAGLAVMSGMARRDDGIGLAWWTLGLCELRFADAEAAIRHLVAGGIGERKWITARDVIRQVRAMRAERHDRAPAPVPPAQLEDDPELAIEERADRQARRQAFIRWYWTAVGNGEAPGRALELAAQGVRLDRYIAARPPEGGEVVGDDEVRRVRGAVTAGLAAERRRRG
ncbi:hypothetical protein GCM10009592_26790 [Brachybacterium rhamnosum]|uniref:DUF222 domain-containing protein n=1 Tax=Brachybacterium rhamnosum TaxID=173361 RepID=A0ABW4Q127_9MICO